MVTLNIKVNINDLGILEEDLNLELYRSYILNKIDSIIKEKIKNIFEVNWKGNVLNDELNKYIDEKVLELLNKQDIDELIKHSIKKIGSTNLIKVIDKKSNQKNIENLIGKEIDEKLKEEYNQCVVNMSDDIKEMIQKQFNNTLDKKVKSMLK